MAPAPFQLLADHQQNGIALEGKPKLKPSAEWRTMAALSQGAANGEVPVGAVLVRDGNILARAHNLVEQQGDPTAHAEMVVIRQVRALLSGTDRGLHHDRRLTSHRNRLSCTRRWLASTTATYMRRLLVWLAVLASLGHVQRGHLLVLSGKP